MAKNSEPNPLSRNSIAQLLAAAIVLEHRQHLGTIAVENASTAFVVGREGLSEVIKK